MKRSKGMVLVDNYWIPKSQAKKFLETRERCAVEATLIMGEFCEKVERCWAGSEDGEAVVGTDQHGEIVCLIHLDPGKIVIMEKAVNEGRLKEYISGTN
ncbi:hypothetical protein [Sporosarcina limicola]|uniref:Uncharacterized protein n=1 Tax=Sporosarcina limicola TaxID=34101 RepID=A0A927MPM3_9BACL|nr:hypothetical protein [Sporosarcina limicola]MBE1556677.1 hypothetical protein [Sporosarcina limicola]